MVGNKNYSLLEKKQTLIQQSQKSVQNFSGPYTHLGDTRVCSTGRFDLVLELFPKEVTVESRSKKSIQLAWHKMKKDFFFPCRKNMQKVFWWQECGIQGRNERNPGLENNGGWTFGGKEVIPWRVPQPMWNSCAFIPRANGRRWKVLNEKVTWWDVYQI